MADIDSEHFMQRIFRLGILAALLTVGPVVLAQQAASVQPPPDLTRAAARVGARSQLLSSTIQGNALSSTNGQLADTYVRLRDARYGRVLGTQMTDKSGLFAFKSLDPGSYIVEIMSPDQNVVLAASEILNVNADEVLSAVVKLPFRMPPFAGVVGSNVVAPSAIAVLTEAAVNGVLIAAAPLLATPACPTQVF